jgi:hypothetical protein
VKVSAGRIDLVKTASVRVPETVSDARTVLVTVPEPVSAPGMSARAVLDPLELMGSARIVLVRMVSGVRIGLVKTARSVRIGLAMMASDVRIVPVKTVKGVRIVLVRMVSNVHIGPVRMVSDVRIGLAMMVGGVRIVLVKTVTSATDQEGIFRSGRSGVRLSRRAGLRRPGCGTLLLGWSATRTNRRFPRTTTKRSCPAR